mgnify:CR=1 FL=1
MAPDIVTDYFNQLIGGGFGNPFDVFEMEEGPFVLFEYEDNYENVGSDCGTAGTGTCIELEWVWTDGCPSSGFCFTFEEQEDGNSRIRFKATVDVAGFQFTFPSACLTDAYDGGATEDAGFIISTSDSSVLGFSLTGATIPMGDYLDGDDFLIEINCNTPGGCTGCYESGLGGYETINDEFGNILNSTYPQPPVPGQIEFEGFTDLDNWFMTSNSGNPINDILTTLNDTITYSLETISYGGGLYDVNPDGADPVPDEDFVVFQYQETGEGDPYVYIEQIEIPDVNSSIQNFIYDPLNFQSSGVYDDDGNIIYEAGQVPTTFPPGGGEVAAIYPWVFGNEYLNRAAVEAAVDTSVDDEQAIIDWLDEITFSGIIGAATPADCDQSLSPGTEGACEYVIYPFQYGTDTPHEYEPTDEDDLVSITYPDIPVSPVTNASTSKFISYPFQEDFINGDFATILANSWYELSDGVTPKNFDFFDTINIYYSTDGADTYNIAAAYFGVWQVTTDTLNPGNIGTSNVEIRPGAAIRFTALSSGGIMRWTIPEEEAS